jgi:hypothetical protein
MSDVMNVSELEGACKQVKYLKTPLRCVTLACKLTLDAHLDLLLIRFTASASGGKLAAWTFATGQVCKKPWVLLLHLMLLPHLL